MTSLRTEQLRSEQQSKRHNSHLNSGWTTWIGQPARAIGEPVDNVKAASFANRVTLHDRWSDSNLQRMPQQNAERTIVFALITGVLRVLVRGAVKVMVITSCVRVTVETRMLVNVIQTTTVVNPRHFVQRRPQCRKREHRQEKYVGSE